MTQGLLLRGMGECPFRTCLVYVVFYVADCTPPYQYIDGGCYFHSDEHMYYHEAMMYCDDKGGDIVTVDSMKEHYRVIQFHMR